jgi:integrase
MKGSIRKRGNSYTVYWSTNDPATGKRVQHTKGGFRYENAARQSQVASGSRAEGDSAREFLNAVIGKVQEGTWRPDSRMTVRQLLEDFWLPAQQSRDLRPATLAQYRLAVNHWIVPNIGGTRIAALTPAGVNELVTTLRTKKSAKGREGLSPRSAQIAVTVLKSAYAWANNNGLMSRNPIAGVQRPRVQRSEMKTWQPAQARAFLASTADDRIAIAWALLLTRGLRRGEVCGLRWAKVDLNQGVMQVESTRVVVEGEALDSTPKTDAGRRPIPLDSALIALLRSHRARQAEEKLAAGEAYEDGGYLLADELGRPYHPDTISKWFDDAVKKAGLLRIRLHDTRHTAASLLLSSGVPTKVVSELLGHSSPTVTLTVYAHTLPSMAEEAGEALSKALLGNTE